MEKQDKIRSDVANYYGKTLSGTVDLKTSACCSTECVPTAHRELLAKLHPEVTSRFYGCGSPIPDSLKGACVLDLGCGSGRDVYLASALVGPSGKVVGVDMTDEQLEVARRHQEYHAKELLGKDMPSNVEFVKGYIEDLEGAGIESNSMDVVISNCVCNLSPDKPKVFSEIARVLKPGGEFYFSDVYADRRIGEEAANNKLLVAECIGGALYVEDFRRIMHDVGLRDIRVVSHRPVGITDVDLKALVPDVQFFSVTLRAFKIDELEDRREDYSQMATYTFCCGSGMKLDMDFDFPKGEEVPVDSNTAAILQQSRFKKKFKVTEKREHRGLFIGATQLCDLLEKEDPKENGDAKSGKAAKAEASCCATASSESTKKDSKENGGRPSAQCCSGSAKACC